MKILIVDTETINLDKPFIYDIGYVIYDTEKQGIVHKKSYVISQVFGNKMLFATSYYNQKLGLYFERLKSKYSKKVGWKNAMRFIANDIKKFNVEKVYAFNSRFDSRAFNFMCAWFKCANPLATLEFCDIMQDIKKFTNTQDYKDFCVENGFLTKHENPRPQQNAETVYKYITNNLEFVEEHTGLEDSIIELDILLYAWGL